MEDVVGTKCECVHFAGLIELCGARISISIAPGVSSCLLTVLIDTLLVLGATEVTKESIEIFI